MANARQMLGGGWARLELTEPLMSLRMLTDTVFLTPGTLLLFNPPQ